MARPSLYSTLSILALSVALAACTVTVAPASSAPQSAADCQGGPNGCSVAAHGAAAWNPPPVAVDVSGQIHDYILAHPEVIAEAQRNLATRQATERQTQAKAALAENRDAVFNDSTDPVIGNPKGDVTIVEVLDYECPFCRRLAPAIDELIKSDPNVKVVVKEYPILGPMSETAAKYGLASMRQGKYGVFHAALMASTIPEHQLTEAQIIGFAKGVGLDIAKLKNDAADPAIMGQIAANRALAQKLAITGTPGLIIGDQIQSGFMSLETLKKSVADARARKLASAR